MLVFEWMCHAAELFRELLACLSTGWAVESTLFVVIFFGRNANNACWRHILRNSCALVGDGHVLSCCQPNCATIGYCFSLSICFRPPFVAPCARTTRPVHKPHYIFCHMAAIVTKPRRKKCTQLISITNCASVKKNTFRFKSIVPIKPSCILVANAKTAYQYIQFRATGSAKKRMVVRHATFTEGWRNWIFMIFMTEYPMKNSKIALPKFHPALPDVAFLHKTMIFIQTMIARFSNITFWRCQVIPQ